MITKIITRFTVVAVVAAILIAALAAHVGQGATPGAQPSPPISRPVDLTKMTFGPGGNPVVSTLDPGFTGGPPQQPNMGTKPPATPSLAPSAEPVKP
jgi:hypothetical protein